MTNYVLIYSEF